MRTVKYTARFKRDYRREKKSGRYKKLDHEMMIIVESLAEDKSLPLCRYDHAMTGHWYDHRDCHIRSDLILIYRKPDIDTLELVRLGSHSELSL